MALRQGRSGRPWRRVQAQVYATESVCHLCGQPVDPTLPANHDMARSVDHIIPLALGGDPTSRANLRLAHRLCNQRKGVGASKQTNPTSRQW